VEGPGKWSAPGPVLALGGPVHSHRILITAEPVGCSGSELGKY